MKRRLLLVGILATALTAPAGLQKVEAQEKTRCETTVDMDIAPGLWREGNAGTYTTNGETGPVTCTGPVSGKQPTGPGTFSGQGRYGTKDPDTCDNAEGIYNNTMTLPTAGGQVRWADQGTWAAGTFKGGGAFGGDFSSDKVTGTFEVTPKEGDCVSKPLTKISALIRWTIKG
jgi:hypothetical protein